MHLQFLVSQTNFKWPRATGRVHFSSPAHACNKRRLIGDLHGLGSTHRRGTPVSLWLGVQACPSLSLILCLLSVSPALSLIFFPPPPFKLLYAHLTAFFLSFLLPTSIFPLSSTTLQVFFSTIRFSLWSPLDHSTHSGALRRKGHVYMIRMGMKRLAPPVFGTTGAF